MSKDILQRLDQAVLGSLEKHPEPYLRMIVTNPGIPEEREEACKVLLDRQSSLDRQTLKAIIDNSTNEDYRAHAQKLLDDKVS